MKTSFKSTSKHWRSQTLFAESRFCY